MQASGAEHVTSLSALPSAPVTSGDEPILQRAPSHHSTSGTGPVCMTEYPTPTQNVGRTQSTDTRSASGVWRGAAVGVTRPLPAGPTPPMGRDVAPPLRRGPAGL